MDKKTCFKCGEEKDLSEFYKHAQMGDGHLNKCKECTRKDVHKHRVENIDIIRAYDRARGRRPERTGENAQRCKEWRKKNSEKYKAHLKANNALRNGLLSPKPCEVCGSVFAVEKHHPDYSKPLEVVFLCSKHHKRAHGQGAGYE